MKVNRITSVLSGLFSLLMLLPIPSEGDSKKSKQRDAAKSRDVESFIAQGLSYEVRGCPQKALMQYQMAVRLYPNDFYGHLFLGQILYEQNRVTAAIQEMQSVVRLKPDYALEHLRLGNALNLTGHQTEARREWQTVLTLENNDSTEEAQKMLKMFPPPAKKQRTSL